MIPTPWHSGKDKTIETVKRSVVGGALEGEEEGWRGGHRGLLGQWDYSLWHSGGGYTTLCPCQKPQRRTLGGCPGVNSGLCWIMMSQDRPASRDWCTDHTDAGCRPRGRPGPQGARVWEPGLVDPCFRQLRTLLKVWSRLIKEKNISRFISSPGPGVQGPTEPQPSPTLAAWLPPWPQRG